MKTKAFIQNLLFMVAASVVVVGCDDKDTAQQGFAKIDFSIDVTDANENSAVISILPSDDAPSFYYSVISESAYAALGSDDELVKSVIAEIADPAVSGRIVSGFAEEKITSLAPSTNYYAFALQMTSKGRSDRIVVKKRFTTTGAVSDFDCEILSGTVTPISVEAEFFPEDKTTTYCSGIVSYDEFESMGADRPAVQRLISKAIETAMQENPYYSRKIIIEKKIAATGDKRKKFMSLEPEKRYVLWSGSIDAEGNVTTNPVVKTVATSKLTYSRAVVTADIPKYYNGTELWQYDSQYSYARGAAVVRVIIEKSVEVNEYYLTFLSGNQEDTAKYSDASLISKLMLQGVKNTQTRSLFYMAWEQTTLCMVALDKDGNFGPVFRKAFQFSENGTSDFMDLINNI